jgi:ABC-type histidine transport system ATPase subunit
MRIEVNGMRFNISDDANSYLFAKQIQQIDRMRQSFIFEREDLVRENTQLKNYIAELETQLKIKADRILKNNHEDQKKAERYISDTERQLTKRAADLAMKELEKAFSKSGFGFTSKT